MKKKAEETISEYPLHMETRVALLEQSINHINQALFDIKNDIKQGLKDNLVEMRHFKDDVKTDLKWLVGLVIAFGSGIVGIMAHGFHWF